MTRLSQAMLNAIALASTVEEMLAFFEQHELANVREALAYSAAEMTTCNLEAANHKTEAISFAYGLTPWALLLFALSLLLAAPGLIN